MAEERSGSSSPTTGCRRAQGGIALPASKAVFNPAKAAC